VVQPHAAAKSPCKLLLLSITYIIFQESGLTKYLEAATMVCSGVTHVNHRTRTDGSTICRSGHATPLRRVFT
jgi:hypothetical protein